MKKFGIGKKDRGSEDVAEDPSRSRLFGPKSKSRSPASISTNPYAVSQDSSKSDPYARSSSPFGASAIGVAQRGPSQPPAYESQGGYGSYSSDPVRNGKSTVPLGGYGASRYSSPGNPGSQSPHEGHDGERFDDSHGVGATSSAYHRAGEYGGLDNSRSRDNMERQAGREALFGDARERYEQRQAMGSLPLEGNSAQGNDTGETDVPDMEYGVHQDRQLTAEEEEEEDVQATKQQIRTIKQQDVSSTRNALRIAEQAEETGRETLERLGVQGERIHNTEKNLDLASNQNRLAEEKARELKHLNRSMWAMRVGNPFTKTRRERDRDETIIAQHQYERAERDATRQAAYASQGRQQEAKKDLKSPSGLATKKDNLKERSKYQFEADSEDEGMEDEIDSNLDALHGAAGRLNQLGRAMGKEVDSQNDHIGRIVGKADKVDDQIVMNRSRLDRIR